MLNKIIRITVYNCEGKEINISEVEGLASRSDGTLTASSSRILTFGLVEIEKGGAIFIERVWQK